MTDLVESLVAQLAQDLCWQSALTEDERARALVWARKFLKLATQQRYVQALGRLRTMNEFMQSRELVSRDEVFQTWLE